MNVTTKVTGPTSLHFDLMAAIRPVQDKSAEGLSKDVKTSATSLFGSGKYADGWTWKRQGDATVVYNAGKHASLSHLLENGHMVVDRSGRNHGFWQPPAQHISPPYMTWRETYLEQLKQAARDNIR